MRRPSSTRISSFFEATAWLAGTLTACLSSEVVDLGSNYDPRPVEPDAPPPSLPESGPDAPPDAPRVQDAEASDAFGDAPESEAPDPPGAPLASPILPSNLFSMARWAERL